MNKHHQQKPKTYLPQIRFLVSELYNLMNNSGLLSERDCGSVVEPHQIIAMCHFLTINTNYLHVLKIDQADCVIKDTYLFLIHACMRRSIKLAKKHYFFMH